MKRTVRIIVLLFITFSACAPTRVNMSNPAFYHEKTSSIVLIKKIEYDPHGLPLFRTLLRERPVKKGEQFTLVYYGGNKPVKSFDIAIVGRNPDITRPLMVIYDWTGKGFQVGVQLAVESMRGVRDKNGLLVPAASMVVGTAAGFVIGVGASIPVAFQEAGTLIADNEVLLGFSEYAYDERGRLRSIRVWYPDEKPRELVRTEYDYHGDEATPFQTTVYSDPENKTRIIP